MSNVSAAAAEVVIVVDDEVEVSSLLLMVVVIIIIRDAEVGEERDGAGDKIENEAGNKGGAEETDTE